MTSQLEHTVYHNFVLDKVKEGGRAPPPSSGWANFFITMECTPESGHCHSVYTLCSSPLYSVYNLTPRGRDVSSLFVLKAHVYGVSSNKLRL